MDPLSLIASVIAVTTLAWQSTKSAYDIVNGLVEAPNIITDSKRLLSQTQNTLDTLSETLDTGNKMPSVLESVLQKIKLTSTLESIQRLCGEFSETLRGYTKHSTDSKFGKRDRLIVSLHESKIARFNKQLGDCQGTMSLVVVSINLHTSEDIERLDGRFTDQAAALVALENRLFDSQKTLEITSLVESDSTVSSDSTSERDLIARLQTVCQDTLLATKAKRTGQSFGNQQTDTQSIAMQGIVGVAQTRVEQSFGNQNTMNGSRAFQGQMDAGSFAAMFGK